MATKTVYVRHKSGANHSLAGRRAARLKREILAGRGGPEVTQLVENGYEGFLGLSGHIEDFENLAEYFSTP